MKTKYIIMDYSTYSRDQRWLRRTIKKEICDSFKYRKMYSKALDDLKHYKDYSIEAYYWNAALMNQINELTMTKTE